MRRTDRRRERQRDRVREGERARERHERQADRQRGKRDGKKKGEGAVLSAGNTTLSVGMNEIHARLALVNLLTKTLICSRSWL